MAIAQPASDRDSIPPRNKPHHGAAAASMTRSLGVPRLRRALAVVGVLCVTLLVSSSTLFTCANSALDGADALQLHMQPMAHELQSGNSTSKVELPSQGEEEATAHDIPRHSANEDLARKAEPTVESTTNATTAISTPLPTERSEPSAPTPLEPTVTDERTAMTRLRREDSQAKGSEQNSTIASTQTPTSAPTHTHTTMPTHTNTGLRTRHDRFDASVSRERGIIISLHDRIVPLGLSLIKDLRCLGNTELIQVYHCYPNELSPESRELLLLNETRVEIIDVCTHYLETKRLSEGVAADFRNWWVKPLALYHTNLREVIVLDADVIPMRDPAVLRSLPGYARTGTTFFYDRVIPCSLYFNSNFRGKGGHQLLRQWIEIFDYAAFNLTGPAPSSHLHDSLAYSRQTCHEMDSSMVTVDKSRAGKAMDVLWLLITQKRFEYDFSWGDKESFWLAFEFAHVDYSFSPWGVSVVSSSPNRDMEDHPDTLCGSLAHFLPVDDETPELLYVNGKALIDPYPDGVKGSRTMGENQLYNVQPTHVTPRHVRAPKAHSKTTYFGECLVGLGSTPLPEQFHWHLLRRRTFYLGILTGVYSPLSHCTMF